MKSENIKEITIALAKAQIAFLPIKRTEKVAYATTGGRKAYNYAPLDEVIEATRKALSDNGLAITQSTYLQGGNTILETLLSHSSGEWLSSELYVGKQDQPPQSEGSALTYKRRYGLSSILCVASEEDDDAEGTGKEKTIQPPKVEKPKAPEPPSIVPDKLTPMVVTEESDSKVKVKEIYDLVKKHKPACKSDKNVEAYLSGVLKTDLARLKTEPDKVLEEVKKISGW